MVAEGAYRKSLNSLTGEVATFTPTEEKRWAHQLLPRSNAPGQALAPPRERPAAGAAPQGPNLRAAATPGNDEDKHPLKGVCYSALTGPGPSGMRPEHAKEMVGIRQRPLAI